MDIKRLQELAGITTESSDYFELKLTAKGQLLLDMVNNPSKEGGSTSDTGVDYWKLNSREERELADIGMYVEGDYTDNRFKSLTTFALDIATSEYQEPEKKYIFIVQKINRAIKKGWAEIVPSNWNGKDDKTNPFIDTEEVPV